MSLGEFLTDEVVRGDLPQKRRHLMTINKPVSASDDPSMIRETYRKHLTELHDAPSLRSAFVGAHQLENLREVAEKFAEAASGDLASTGPQVDQRFLNALLVELGKLKTFRTVYETAQEVRRHLPPDVDRCLMEKTFKDALRNENIFMPDGSQRTMVDLVLRDRKPWQMPVANYRDTPDELAAAAAARDAQEATVGALRGDLQAAEAAHYEANRG